jgi:uncharacterized protein YggE
MGSAGRRPGSLRSGIIRRVSITVTAHGVVMAVPDVATVGAGVECRRPTAREALAAASVALDTLLGAVDAVDVDRSDVRTSAIALAPQWDQAASRFTEFVASAGLGVTLREPSRIGELLDAMVDAVGDDIRVHGIGLEVEDDDDLRRQARDAAFADAREKRSSSLHSLAAHWVRCAASTNLAAVESAGA